MKCQVEGIMSADLTANQRIKLQDVLREFIETFKTDGHRGTAKTNIKHRINTGDHPPISQRAYRVSPTERRTILAEVQKMLKNDIIRSSKTRVANPNNLAGHFRKTV